MILTSLMAKSKVTFCFCTAAKSGYQSKSLLVVVSWLIEKF